MKSVLIIFGSAIIGISCSTISQNEPMNIQGTWKLLSGTIIQQGDTTSTQYSGSRSMIKIINESHFSFLNHDTRKGKDTTATFGAGGGRYRLVGNNYTEFLEYCSAREWEGNSFHFTVTVQGDTLTQTGIERIESLGIDRLNVEKYVRLK